MTAPHGRGDAPIEAPQMPNASRTNPIPSHINVVADTPVWGSQPGSIAHISALSECIFCGPDHPEGVVHSDAEIRAYERGRAAARAEGRQEAVREDVRCVNCWHDKGHHVHWYDDRIGACVLVYGGGQGRCPCEQYAARHGRSSDPTEADDE